MKICNEEGLWSLWSCQTRVWTFSDMYTFFVCFSQHERSQCLLNQMKLDINHGFYHRPFWWRTLLFFLTNIRWIKEILILIGRHVISILICFRKGHKAYYFHPIHPWSVPLICQIFVKDGKRSNFDSVRRLLRHASTNQPTGMQHEMAYWSGQHVQNSYVFA